MGWNKGFSTASSKYWIKNVKNGENYSPTNMGETYASDFRLVLNIQKP